MRKSSTRTTASDRSSLPDAELYELGNMSSSSPAMFKRRRRILSEARHLIQANGSDFSVRELCSRAGVAPNTLYNAFGSKEQVIALTVTRYFEEFFTRTIFTHPADSLEGMVERNIAASLRNIELPHYVHAVTRLYFSDNERLSIRPEMNRLVGRFILPWLQHLQLQHGLAKGVDLQMAPGNLAAIGSARLRRQSPSASR